MKIKFFLSFMLFVAIAIFFTGCGGSSGTPSNQAPTANAGTDKSTWINQTVTITGSGSDTDGTVVSYQWKEGNTVLANVASFNYTPVTTGDHTLTLTVTDDDGATGSDTMTITATEVITPVNHAPTANAGADITTEVNQTITITGSGSDTDGTIVSYQWKEENTVLANVTSFSYTPTTRGTHTLTLTVTDDDGATGSDTMGITATDNTIPLADSDNDHIPDNIEIMMNTDPNNPDENNNSVLDGLDTEGNHGDTFFDRQWHIRSLGTYTNDSNVLTIVGNDLDLLDTYHLYMGYNRGNNIIVQVVDNGVDADHEDLVNNMDLTRSYNGENIGDPSPNPPNQRTDTHGTMVAGIMAAEAFNGKGVRGIIPFAKIAGSNWLENQSTAGLEKVWLTGAGANEIAVSNNSWGLYYDTDTVSEEIMQKGTNRLRDGKGRIYVFAAGNDREERGNANLQYPLSNRYAIAVAGLKHDNTYASYSTPGSNILVSGYSGDNPDDSPTISTTTIMGTSSNTGDINTKTTWIEDTNENYTYAMNGTSAASPTVAASIALVLEACPNLTWRDVKYLTAKHAKHVDPSNNTWVTNSAGLKHSIDYGFGLINVKGMILDCNSTSYTNLSVEQNKTVIQSFNTPIADNNTIHSFTINMPDNIIIEWVEVTVDNNSTYASDYRVELTSPQGTKTTLMTEKTTNGINYITTSSWMDGGFRLSTAAMMDEISQGDWKIDITDVVSDDQGTLKNIKLKIYGH